MDLFKAIAEQSEILFPELLDESLVEYKKLDDTYLYTKATIGADYNKMLIQFIKEAERIDTNSKEFQDILFDIKRRRISDGLLKIIHSPNIVLGILNNRVSLPKVFRTFTAKDIKTDPKGNTYRIFIDCTEFIKLDNGIYQCKNLEWLLSYLIAGIVTFIYKMQPDRLMLNQTITSKSTICYTRLLSYIIDRLVKITSTPQIKMKIDYYIAYFYLYNVMCKNDMSHESLKGYALKASGISDIDAIKVDAIIDQKDFADLDIFCKALSKNFNIEINTSGVTATWLQVFQTGTQYAIEFFPAFSMMLTHTYNGGYLVNQTAIEKICGTDFVLFVKEIYKIIDEVAK